jgi:hypothetical protein
MIGTVWVEGDANLPPALVQDPQGIGQHRGTARLCLLLRNKGLDGADCLPRPRSALFWPKPGLHWSVAVVAICYVG